MTINHFVKSTLVFALLLSATMVFAQDGQNQKKTPEERAANQTAWMQKNLGLTGDQFTKVHDIILASARSQENVNTAAGNNTGARQKIAKNRDEQIKNVLTADQYTKYQAHVEEMKQKMMERRGNMGQ